MDRLPNPPHNPDMLAKPSIFLSSNHVSEDAGPTIPSCSRRRASSYQPTMFQKMLAAASMTIKSVSLSYVRLGLQPSLSITQRRRLYPRGHVFKSNDF